MFVVLAGRGKGEGLWVLLKVNAYGSEAAHFDLRKY